MKYQPHLMKINNPDGTVEYLESVSTNETIWTTDPDKAIHFLSTDLIPVTTVILRSPILECLKQGPELTASIINLRKSIADWFRPHLLPQEIPDLNEWKT